MPDVYVSNKKEAIKNKKEKILTSLKERTTNPLAAFMANPHSSKMRFETQEGKEKIILLLRRHLITNLSWLFMTVIFIFAPTVFLKIFPLELPEEYQLIIHLTWYLGVFAFAFEKFLSWFFNVNILTDERIIDLDFPSILYKDTTETKIDQVQDVSVKVGGYTRSLFNFGDVNIQTAGAVPQIFFEAVPDPGRVAKVLNELKLEEEREKLEGRVR